MNQPIRLLIALATLLSFPAAGTWAQLPVAPVAQEAPVPAHIMAQRSEAGLLVHTAQGTVRIEPWSDRVIHVLAAPEATWQGNYNPAVIGAPSAVKWTVAETTQYHVLATAALQVRVAKATGVISFHDGDGKVVLEELDHGRSAAHGAPISQRFVLDAPVFGLGQHLTGVFDYRGTSVHLQQANRDVAVPMLVSARGFGVLWNNAGSPMSMPACRPRRSIRCNFAPRRVAASTTILFTVPNSMTWWRAIAC